MILTRHRADESAGCLAPGAHGWASHVCGGALICCPWWTVIPRGERRGGGTFVGRGVCVWSVDQQCFLISASCYVLEVMWPGGSQGVLFGDGAGG